jgi:hypothetical protein
MVPLQKFSEVVHSIGLLLKCQSVDVELVFSVRGRNSPGLDYSVRWVSGRDEGGFGKGFGLSLCAVPLTQLVPHLGWRCG